MGEELATEEADSLNLTGDEYIEDRMEELNRIPASIVERRIRNSIGQVMGVEKVSNPELS